MRRRSIRSRADPLGGAFGSAEPARGMSEDRIDLAGVRHEIGAPLRAVAVILAELRQATFEFLHVAVGGFVELWVVAVPATDLVERLLPRLGVKTAGNSGCVAATMPIPHLARRSVVDQSGDALGERLERLGPAGGKRLVRVVA